MDGSHQLSDEHRVVGSLLSGRPAELAGPGDQADQAVARRPAA